MKPDVLILDIDRSAYKGIALLRQISRECAFLDVIVITDASSSFFRRKCVEAGAKFFFDKATEFQKIPQAIESLRKRVHHSSN
jgi:DNA-binding NarL/FixJ family response regulator